MRKAVFIDRDGVICHNRDDYVKSWEEFVFLPGARRALARLAQLDLPIIVVTNQSAINRGLVAKEVVEDIHKRMVRAIEAADGRVDRVIYCPHRPDEDCDCRKPRPGMLLKAAKEFQLDLAQCYFIGDAETDMKAARTVGCQRFLVLTGRGRRQLFNCWLHGERDFSITPHLGTAVHLILGREIQAERRMSRLTRGEGWGC